MQTHAIEQLHGSLHVRKSQHQRHAAAQTACCSQPDTSRRQQSGLCQAQPDTGRRQQLGVLAALLPALLLPGTMQASSKHACLLHQAALTPQALSVHTL